MNFLTQFQETLKNAENIAIFTHKNNDHDCICSAVALQIIIEQMFGKKSTIFVDKMPTEAILCFCPHKNFSVTALKEFDVGITVDCAGLNLLCDESLKVFQRCKTTFNIDHHKDNTDFATFNYVKRGFSSCCEVLFWLFEKHFSLTFALAKAFYTGILMDCGMFCYSSANSKTLLCASKILKAFPEVKEGFFVCFGVAGFENFSITKKAFESVRFYENRQIAVSILRKSDFEECGCKREDGKFIVSYLQNIAGVKIAISISEDDKNEWRISLRTPCHDIDVSKIAHKFNGGGHKQASGLTLKGELEKALKALVLESKKELKWTDFLILTNSLA